MCSNSKNEKHKFKWENTPKEIEVTIANQENIKLDKVCKNLIVYFAEKPFPIPMIYQQEIGIDLILGNNFCQLYGLFTQWLDRISFNLNQEMILIKKDNKGFQLENPDSLEKEFKK